jgi:hypothetical protein
MHAKDLVGINGIEAQNLLGCTAMFLIE